MANQSRNPKPPKPKTQHTKLSPTQLARRLDPAGLWRERKAFLAAIDKRLMELAKAVGGWVEYASANPTLVANALPSDPAKAKEFQTWLEKQLADGLLETVDGPPGVGGDVPWTDQYVRPVYKKALIDTYGAVRGPLPEGLDGANWLQQSFNGPVAVRSLGHIYNRQYAGLKDITSSIESTLQRTLANAMAQGQDVRTTARQMQQAVGFSRARAKRFATTELQHMYAEGQLDSMDTLGVNTVNLAVEWLTAGDHKVCKQCQAQAGKTYSTKDARGLIPFHPNCVLPGHYVSGRVIRGIKAEYSGEVVEVFTAGGHKFTVTSDHPVMTPNGPTKAHLLNHGTYLLAYGGQPEPFVGDMNEQYGPMLIEDVFEAFGTAGRAMPNLGFNLDSDGHGRYGDVHVVGADGEMKYGFQVHEGESVEQRLFTPAGGCGVCVRDLGSSLFGGAVGPYGPVGLRSREGLQPVATEYPVNEAATNAPTVGHGLGGFPVGVAVEDGSHKPRGHFPLVEFTSLGPASNLDTVFSEPSPDGIRFNPNFVSELFEAFTGEVVLDEVISVRKFHYAGPVYDVETVPGYFVTGADATGKGVLVQNCRCAWIPGVPEMVGGALAEGQQFIQEYNAEVQHKNALASAAKLALLNKDPIAKYVAGLKADARNGKDDGFALHPLPLEKFTVGDNKIIRDAANAGEWSLETVDLDALATGQRIVERDKVLEYAKNPFEAVKDEDLPLVYRRADGKLIVKDGNHRVVAALARGDKSLKVRVIPEVQVPKPVVPKPVAVPKIIKGSPYDKSKIEAYVAANVDKKGYVRAFKKVELEKAEVSFANKTAKGIKETTDIELAGLQTINGGQYGDALPYKAKALVDDPSEVKIPVVLQRPDGSRVVISGDVELTVAIANGDTHIAVKLVTMQGDVVGAAKAAADTKLAAAEAVRDAFAKKIGLQGKASLPLNDKGLLDAVSLKLAFEKSSGMQYRNGMANIMVERLAIASRKQTLEGQLAEIEAMAKQLKIIPREKLYPIGTPRGLPTNGKVPGADLKPLREVVEKDILKAATNGSSLVKPEGYGVKVTAKEAMFDAMAERARAMEKEYDKLKVGPPTPKAIKPKASPAIVKQNFSGDAYEIPATSQAELDGNKEINRAFEFLNRVGDRNTMAEAMPEVAVLPGRAYASNTGHIALDPLTDASTVVHEYAHHIEYKLSDEGYAKLVEFTSKRQGKEVASQIYTRADLADEVGYKDDYLKAVMAVRGPDARATSAHYAGKVYPEYRGRRSTEVITIGAELLFRDPVAFAKADPEWFDLVEGVLSGRIR